MEEWAATQGRVLTALWGLLVALGLWILNRTWQELKALREQQADQTRDLHKVTNELTAAGANAQLVQKDIEVFKAQLHGLGKDVESLGEKVDNVRGSMVSLPRRLEDRSER